MFRRKKKLREVAEDSAIPSMEPPVIRKLVVSQIGSKEEGRWTYLVKIVDSVSLAKLYGGITGEARNGSHGEYDLTLIRGRKFNCVGSGTGWNEGGWTADGKEKFERDYKEVDDFMKNKTAEMLQYVRSQQEFRGLEVEDRVGV